MLQKSFLIGRFTFREPSLVLARVRLLADRLELSGWRLRGRYRRVLPMSRIRRVHALCDDSLLVWLADDEAVRIHVGRPHEWKEAIERAMFPEQSRVPTRGRLDPWAAVYSLV